MKHSYLKNALLGVAIALVAAFLYPVVLVALMDGPRGLRFMTPGLLFAALLYTSWAVIPLGAALGMLIPRIVAGKKRWVAALYSAGYGALGGLAAMICFSNVFFNESGLDLFWVSFVIYCAVWVGAYGCVRAKAPVAHR